MIFSWRTLWAMALMISLVACQTAAPLNSNSPTELVATSTADKGNFQIKVQPSEKIDNFPALFQDMVTELETWLNSTYRLPEKNIVTEFKDCGEPNAFYSLGTGKITMCSELYALMAQQFKQEDAQQVFRFIFLHELGHALVDQFELPILGKEEDAVDAMATVLLIEEDQSYRAALLAAINFYAMSQGQVLVNWADNHSIGPQRMFNLVCWATGARPEILSIRTVAVLNAQLAQSGRRCDLEYQQQKNAVEKLLKPFKKTP